MNLVINALASTQLSGKHVLLGHLRQIARTTHHQVHVLHHQTNADLARDFGPRVHWHPCPNNTHHWLHRAIWERRHLPNLLHRLRADLLFMNSGTTLPHCPIPQISLALNPWSMVPAAHYSQADRAKALLQRHAYRNAIRQADAMLYCSTYLRSLYETNAQRSARQSNIAFCGLDDDVLAHPNTDTQRTPGTILCVSRMMPHKRVERLINLLPNLPQQHHLRLVGGWASSTYRHQIKTLIQQRQLQQRVTLVGHLTRPQLFEEYRRAQVLALMSCCESFAIPIIEAQHFGTPVVCANACAMPEVGGPGGLFPDPDNPEACRNALHQLLDNPTHWTEISQAARDNAQRFTYETTSQPLLQTLASFSPPT